MFAFFIELKKPSKNSSPPNALLLMPLPCPTFGTQARRLACPPSPGYSCWYYNLKIY